MQYDHATEERLKEVMPEFGNLWLKVRDKFWIGHGIQLKVAQGLRTFAQQWKIYAQGRERKLGTWTIVDKDKVVSYAPPGQSYHNFGLAIDSCFIGPDPYLANEPKERVGNLWNDYGIICRDEGLRWGGDFIHKDFGHCENNYGLDLHQIQILYEHSGINAVWDRCRGIK